MSEPGILRQHAQIAACLIENGQPPSGLPVLGIVLGGMTPGDDRTLWGGEFLLADFRAYERLGTLKPVALPGGERATRAEPWRSLYAHLMAEMGWARFAMDFADLPLKTFLAERRSEALAEEISDRTISPLASSCGRLFDAAAAALGLGRPEDLEAAVDPAALDEEETLIYPFAIPRLGGRGLPYIEPLGAWAALLGDLLLETPIGTIAARFHRSFARSLVAMAQKLLPPRVEAGIARPTVVLTGGCFQNRILREQTLGPLERAGFEVLTHSNEARGIAEGEAAIRSFRRSSGFTTRFTS
ncbi:MAG TPA: hypothetical protein VN851_13690 [Thermoanaerobaculia bacterium]|nr:hypothetical protein [Thermoanaerobaculia bacterium]